MSVGPVEPAAPLAHAWADRRVEHTHQGVFRRPDVFARTLSVDPFDAPAGSVPYHRFLESQNVRALAQGLAMERAAASIDRASAGLETPGLGMPKLGETSPIEPEPEAPAPARPLFTPRMNLGAGQFLDAFF